MNQSQMPTTQPGKNLCHVKTRRKEPILEEKTAKGEKVRDLGVATRALFSCDDRTAAVDGGAPGTIGETRTGEKSDWEPQIGKWAKP